MPQQFLYEQLDGAVKMGLLKVEIPDFVRENLTPRHVLREYQKEALGRFMHCYNNEYEGKQYPLHFLFNMATGSGKTLVMAALIVYLYERGHRNFLFFVNSTNIIRKTEDNFLNEISGKYLFSDTIEIGGNRVSIRKVDNFEDANTDDINICFTTVQKMHGDLHNEKENALTFEDFKNKSIVLLSDEAHHSQAGTKQGALAAGMEKPTWENTVEKILRQDSRNLLLEFTATMDFSHRDVVEKYRNKVLYRYDLKQFRNDGYSKEPQLLASDTDTRERMLQAIILSQYRQEVAGKHGVNLKPVVLFKAQKTIDQSQKNKTRFHELVGALSAREIADVRRRTNVDVLKQAFSFFTAQGVSDALLARKLRDGFAENKCLSVNDEHEKEEYQLLINSLEDPNNQIRAIFAVQKLNEGWDVLNLFDIVRLYDTRDGKRGKPGKTTIAEAQLIGRGARYFPFRLPGQEDKFRRKYDKDLEHELRILEELHYHSHNESRYISEIKTALIEQGMMDDNEIEVELKLKEDFKRGRFYASGIVYRNERMKRTFEKVQSIADLGVGRRNVSFNVRSGKGEEVSMFVDGTVAKRKNGQKNGQKTREMKVSDFEPHIVQNALAHNDFFSFANLAKYFPAVRSVREFGVSKAYLGGLSVTLRGSEADVAALGNIERFQAVLRLLEEMEREIKETVTEYRGTRGFKPSRFKLVFADKKIKVRKDSERADGQHAYIEDKEWYIFDSHYGTSEERDFLDLMARHIAALGKNFKEVYLVRNERQMKIYNFADGRGFEPDYLLFLVDKKGKRLTYQIFVEPKGGHLLETDKWKDDFLKDIAVEYKNKVLKLGRGTKYKILGVPFYNSENENEFMDKLKEAIS